MTHLPKDIQSISADGVKWHLYADSTGITIRYFTNKAGKIYRVRGVDCPNKEQVKGAINYTQVTESHMDMVKREKLHAGRKS